MKETKKWNTMDLFIGRKRTTNQLIVLLEGREFPFGEKGEVSNTVSSVHCMLKISSDDKMRIINLKEGLNSTWVDGVMVSDAEITENSKIALGSDQWPLPLSDILDFFRPTPYDISHLEEVYNKYQDESINLNIKQGRFATIRTVSGSIGILGGFLSESFRLIIIVCSSILVAIFQWMISKNLPLKRKKLKEDFQATYVCPNPKCKRSFSSYSYEDLKKMKNCPYCKKPLVSDVSGKVTEVHL